MDHNAVIGLLVVAFLAGFVGSIKITREATVSVFEKMGRFFDRLRVQKPVKAVATKTVENVDEALKQRLIACAAHWQTFKLAIKDRLNAIEAYAQDWHVHTVQKEDGFVYTFTRKAKNIKEGWRQAMGQLKQTISKHSMLFAILAALPIAVSSGIFFYFSGLKFRLGMGAGGLSGLLHHPTWLSHLSAHFDHAFAITLTIIGSVSAFCLYASNVHGTFTQWSQPSVGQGKVANAWHRFHPFFVLLPVVAAVVSLGYQIHSLAQASFWSFFPLILIVLVSCIISRMSTFSRGYVGLRSVFEKPIKAWSMKPPKQTVPASVPYAEISETWHVSNTA